MLLRYPNRRVTQENRDRFQRHAGLQEIHGESIAEPVCMAFNAGKLGEYGASSSRRALVERNDGEKCFDLAESCIDCDSASDRC